MRNPFVTVRRALLAAPLALALLAAGCGGDDSTTATMATPAASEFPKADGQTLEQLAQKGPQSELVFAPTQSVFTTGENRFGFGVFTVDRKNVPDAQVALYAAKPGQPAVGPFPATAESLATAPAFRSQTTSTDPDAAAYVYKAEVDLPSKGLWQVLAMVRKGDGSYAVSPVPQGADVGKPNDIPAVGEKAPAIHTPTADDVGGDLAKIDTRTPPDTMHDGDFADVVGKQPVVLLFATPALCTSRVCGPVVDIAEELQSRFPDVAFIHMEIWKDNDPNKGPRPQVLDYGLQTEPWLFVVDAQGKISSRIEGAFSADELTAAIEKATGDSPSGGAG